MSWASLNVTQNNAAAAVLTTLTSALGSTEGLALLAAVTALEAADLAVGMTVQDCREHARKTLLHALDETIWGDR